MTFKFADQRWLFLLLSFALLCHTATKAQVATSSLGDTTTLKQSWTTTLENKNGQTPQFIFLTPNKKFALEISGHLNVTGNYDFNGFVEGPDFIPTFIETPNSTIKNGQLNLDIKTSRLSFRVVDYNVNGKNLEAYLETDFRGDGKTLRIRRGFIAYGGLLIGQEWTTMMDLEAFPDMVNFQGPNAAFANWPIMIRYTHQLTDNLEACIAIEEPYLSLNQDGLNSRFVSKPQTLPNIPLYIQYAKNGSHIRLTGLLNPMSYHNQDINKNYNAYGWTAQLSGLAQLSTKLSACFNGLYGHGVANLTQDFYDLGYNLTPSVGNPNQLKPLPMLAAYGLLRYKLRPDLALSGGYSFVKFDHNDAAAASWYKKGDMAWGTIFWNPTDYFQVGLEYTWGQRINVNKDNGSANRIAAMIQYNF